MRHQSMTYLVRLLLVLCALLLCHPTYRALAESKPDCSLQAQNSASLAAIRYISILEAMQNGTVDQAVQDMDWWIDQAIMELTYLEDKNPDRQLEENMVGGSEEIIRYKRIYRDIARYRADHPRRHKVPLDNQQLKMIDDFVKKYK